MNLVCQESHLEAWDIKDRWEILNVFLGALNSERVEYKIWSQESMAGEKIATFYLHGLGGYLDDCPGLEDTICPHMPMIRVSCFGISNPANAIGYATFGDVCAFLHNSRQSISTIADILRLESFNVVAHSWGGFIACLTALSDPRCKKAMLLCSTPDICDALSQMYKLVGLPDLLYPLADLFMGKLRFDAEKAKDGKAWHQDAWERISPYGEVRNPRIQILIFNRSEDQVMRPWNAEHFLAYSRQRRLKGITTEFITCPDLPNWHDMPPEKFTKRMERFLFDETPDRTETS